MGYILCWTVMLTAIAVSCSLPAKIKFRKLIKGYLIAYWSFPVIALCCMGFYAAYFPGLVKSVFVPTAKVLENEHYILRKAPFDVRMRGDCLYVKKGLLEIYVGDTGYEEQDGGYSYINPARLPADTDARSFEVSLEKNIVTIACADTLLIYRIIKM